MDSLIRYSKLVLLGDTGVGKSSIINRAVKNYFDEFNASTIGAAFFTHMVKRNTRTIRFEIWDTAGQERYRSLAPMYYRDAQVVFVVYDVTKPGTLSGALKWIEELHSYSKSRSIIALIGNKCDLSDDNKEQNIKSAVTYTEGNEFIHHLVSAKTGKNVSELFDIVADKILALPQAPLNIKDFPKVESLPFKSDCC